MNLRFCHVIFGHTEHWWAIIGRGGSAIFENVLLQLGGSAKMYTVPQRGSAAPQPSGDIAQQ